MKTIWILAAISIFVLLVGGGAGYVGFKMGRGDLLALTRERDGFFETVQRQRDANLELVTRNAHLEAAALADAEENRRNIERVGELESLLGQSEESGNRIAELAKGATGDLGGATASVDRIEAIIDAIERGDRDLTETTP